ncbi:MAG: hypothetical protein AAF720_06620 [Pseudomonadota bacterium]
MKASRALLTPKQIAYTEQNALGAGNPMAALMERAGTALAHVGSLKPLRFKWNY